MAEGWREVTKSKMDLDSEVCDDFSFPLSVPSQPPDIRNWFSNYESQELSDPIKDLDGFVEDEEDETETQDPLEDSRRRKHQESIEAKSFSSEKLRSEVSNEILIEEKIGEKIQNENYPVNNSTGTKSAVKKKQSLKKILGDEFLISCQKIINDDSSLSKTEAPKANNCYTESIQEKSRIESQDFNPIESEQKRKEEEEEESKENYATNGFVSIKCKPKFSKEMENLTKKGDNNRGFNNPLREKSNFERKNREEGGIRIPLMDRTNYSVRNEIKREELTGKWKCPQKRKPYVGPPLKQLRIEQWLN